MSEQGHEASRPARVADLVRGDARPTLFIALDAALRALPELRAYGEQELTRHIARACIDYSSARRYLVEEGLLTRESGVYRFTEAGAAVWRVEHHILDHYLR